jgi:hypothetical protein
LQTNGREEAARGVTAKDRPDARARESDMHEDFTRASQVKNPKDRTFGYVMAAFFVLLAVLPLLRHPSAPPRSWAIAIAAAFALVATFSPAALKPLNRLWTRFGLLLHRIVSPVMLAAMFYGVIVPVGFMMRRAGKDSLRLRPAPQRQTYWIERAPGPAAQSMKQQF